MTIRAEHDSLADYLRQELTPAELSHVGLISFNQWSFALGAVCETALTARDLGSRVTVGFWSGRTPLYDTGWTAHRSLARLLGSRSRDSHAYRALRAAGFPKSTFARPPLRPWKPQSALPTLEGSRRDAIRALTYRGSGMGQSILQVHPDSNTPIRDDYEWPTEYVAQAIRSYAWAYDQAYALIQQRGLTTVVVYNGRFTHDRAVAAAADAHGIRTLYYDTGGYQTDFDLTTATTHDWQHLQLRMKAMHERWGDAGDSLGAQWFLDRQHHTDPNNSIFVSEQKKGHLPDIPDTENLIVFFSSSGDEIAELDLDWNEYFHSQENALSQLADVCRAIPHTALIVRTHPHMRLKPRDDLERWVAAVDAVQPTVHFGPDSSIDSYALMGCARVVFTYGSTSGVEAAFQGVPVVVMGPSAYDTLGCARRIATTHEIREAIETPPLAYPQGAIPYGLMMQRRGFVYSHGTKDPDNTPVVTGIRLADASEPVRKISEWLKLRQTQRLT